MFWPLPAFLSKQFCDRSPNPNRPACNHRIATREEPLNNAPPVHIYNTTNELAKERNRAAAERTLTAWIQSGLTLIGFGVAFDQIFGALRRTLPTLDSSLNRNVTTAIGLGAIALGLALLALTVIEYPIKLRAIEQGNYLTQPLYPSIALITTAVLLFGCIALIAVLLNISTNGLSIGVG